MFFEQANRVKQVVCISVGGYPDALTYGKTYEVLAWDDEKHQLRVPGDNGRRRWYAYGHFAVDDKEIVRITHIQLDEQLQVPETSIIDVTVILSNEQRQWCFFCTPEHLIKRDGEQDLGNGQLLMLYNVPHMILVNVINQDIIEKALRYIESQGQLLECTRYIRTGADIEREVE